MAKRASGRRIAKKVRRAAPRRAKRSAEGILYEDVASAFQREMTPDDGSFPYVSGFDLAHLRAFFGGLAIADIGSASAVEYALQRQKQGPPIATINEELLTLTKILTFAFDGGEIRQCPWIEYLRQPPAPLTSAPQVPAFYRQLAASAASPPRAKPSTPRGRTPNLTDAELQKNLDQHRKRPGWNGSDGQRAKLLSDSLKRPITHDQVRRARERLGLPPA